MKKREIYTSGVRLREDGGEDSRTIEGYAIMFGVPSVPLWRDEDSEAREVIAPEAVTKALLDKQDIKMTMFHNREKNLARSVSGKGSLRYEVDAKGVRFEFEAPDTVWGDEAVELVRRGIISGCSFAFTVDYGDRGMVERSSETVDGVERITYTVRQVYGIHDFTLAADPAYPSTSVACREDYEGKAPEPEPEPAKADYSETVAALRRLSNHKLN